MGQHLETRIRQAIDRGKNGLMFPLGLGFVRQKLPIGTVQNNAKGANISGPFAGLSFVSYLKADNAFWGGTIGVDTVEWVCS